MRPDPKGVLARVSDPRGTIARVTTRLVVSGLVWGVVACGVEPGASSDTASRTGEARGWRLVEDLRVGGESGPAFGQIPDLAVSPDGGAYVLDGDAREIVQVDAQGEEVRRMGGPGDGPGLLDYPRRLRLIDGVLWVDDLGAGRWSAFDTTGSFLQSLDTPARVTGGNADMTPDGLIGIGMFREGDRVSRFSGRWLAEEGGFRRVDSLAPPPVPEVIALQTQMSQGGRPVSVAYPIPLAHQPTARPDPRGGGWIITPGGGDYRIVWVDYSGEVRREVSHAYDPVPVPTAEREVQVERLPPDLRAESADQVPDSYPPFDRVVPGADGSLWTVRRVAAPSGGTRLGFDVFGPDGRFLGEAAGEGSLDGLWLHHVDGDAAWGVRRDEQGRPVVVRYRIERR